MNLYDASVIIPTYNRITFLKEAVASVFLQKDVRFELIVVDDGSTDGTWEWLKGAVSETIKIFRQENQGPAAARNLGVRQARGRWIAFLDSDDYWLKGKLSTQVDFLRAHSDYKICQTEEIWIRRGVRVNPQRKHRKPAEIIFENCLPLCLISPSAVMMEREFFLGLGGFDESFPVCEDYDLWLRTALNGKIRTLPQKLTVKRGGHSDQLSHQYPAMDRFRVLAMEKVLEAETLNPSQRKALLAEMRRKLMILSHGFSKHHEATTNPFEEKLQCVR